MKYFTLAGMAYLLATAPVIFAEGDPVPEDTTLITAVESASAEERWFQVELIVFENPTVEVDSPEIWPTYPNIKPPANFIKLEGISEILTLNSETDIEVATEIELDELSVEVEAPESDKGLQGFYALSEFERQLVTQREVLDKSRNYRVLFHEAWNQAVPNKENVIPIKLNGGERYGRQSELQGYISLFVERYLHFSTDLHLIQYEKSSDPFSVVEDLTLETSASDTLQQFGGLSLLNADSTLNNQISRKSNQFFIATSSAQLKESRRMYSKRIYYLDNPRFGLIILITPVITPETVPLATTSPEAQ